MSLEMTFREWIDYQLDPRELILNASAIDGSDFHQHHPIGISVFAIPWLPQKMGECKFVASQSNLCSAMFQPGTTRKKNHHRLDRVEELSTKPFVTPTHWCVKEHRTTAQAFMEQLLCDRFTCSPRGHGVDCHRNYEAILCKCIPLITGHDESLVLKYQNLPVVFLESYKEITVESLEATYEQMMETTYNFSPLLRSHWYRKRPDVNIDMQSEKWMRKFNRWEKWGQYVRCKPVL